MADRAAALREQATRPVLNANKPSGDISEIPAPALPGSDITVAVQKQANLEQTLLPDKLSREAQAERDKKANIG